jgi:hypothetical protein
MNELPIQHKQGKSPLDSSLEVKTYHLRSWNIYMKKDFKRLYDCKCLELDIYLSKSRSMPMASNDSFLQSYSFDRKTSSLIDELEAQVQEALERKKRKVEEELKDKIRLEQEEAKRKIDQIENVLTDEKGALANYKNIISQFEANKGNVKKEIERHIERVSLLRSEIEEKTRAWAQEMEIVKELSMDLDEINSVFGSKVSSFGSTIKDRYDIDIQLSQSNEHNELAIDLEKELTKLSGVKNLLNNSDKDKSDTKTKDIIP